MKVLVVIPSRLASTRFPGKPLVKIEGREMILRVCDQASKAYEVIVATPDKEIVKVVEEAGYKAFRTKGECPTGTDRVCEVAESVPADIYVNVQGDEPVIKIEDIHRIVLAKQLCYNNVINGMSRLQDNSSNIVKVIQDNGRLLNMTRKGSSDYRQHGIYAYNVHELKAYGGMTYGRKLDYLRRHEDIEIMRFHELGIPVKMVEVEGSPAVDVPADLKKIMEVLKDG